MPDHVVALTIGGAALVLFVWNRLPVEVTGLCVLCALLLTGLVSPTEALSGFANEALLTVAAMFVLSAGLVRTGAVDALSRWLSRAARGGELRLLLATFALVLPLSAFLNNTPVVAIMIPVVLGLCRTHNLSPSRLLMPISFASQLGGTLTLIGTSTNLLVAALVQERGLARFGLFDITAPAFLLLLVGVIYLLTLGRWLMPQRQAGTDLVSSYELRDYLATLIVAADSKLVGKTLGSLEFLDRFGLEVLAIEHEGRLRRSPGPRAELQAGARLLVEGKAKDLLAAEQNHGLELATDAGLPPTPVGEEGGDEAVQWAELIVPPRSRLIGRPLQHASLPARYGCSVLGVRRGRAVQPHHSLGDMRLEQGDLLLVQARASSLMAIHSGRDLALLGALDVPVPRRRRQWLAIVTMLVVILVAAMGILPIVVAALVGCCVLFLGGCLLTEEAYEDIDWSVLLLIACMLPMGLVMQRSGVAAMLADGALAIAGPAGPQVALGAFYLVTSILTEFISNNAAAVVLVPIAIAAAQGLDVSPLPFVVAVMLAASNSFMSPIGYQTNLFVFAPGGYRFIDFLRVGGPLNLLLVFAAAIVIPWFFPF